MVTLVVDTEHVSVPSWVVDLKAFRRWAQSEEFPEEGRICYLKGEVWVDMSKEQIFSHVLVKTEYTARLSSLVKSEQLGLFLGDGVRLSNVAADISVKPDCTFVATQTLQSGRVQLIEGARGGYVELEGSPDMVLEIMSAGSVQKDTEILFEAYWEAGIREYWLVDARQDPPSFDIYRYTSKGYVARPKPGGWIKSAVFGKAFRLNRGTSALGHPEFTLEVR
jgi:Uma2 family endonuclease